MQEKIDSADTLELHRRVDSSHFLKTWSGLLSDEKQRWAAWRSELPCLAGCRERRDQRNDDRGSQKLSSF
jgi:hypothetical protein